jgi:hypothetical protein
MHGILPCMGRFVVAKAVPARVGTSVAIGTRAGDLS